MLNALPISIIYWYLFVFAMTVFIHSRNCNKVVMLLVSFKECPLREHIGNTKHTKIFTKLLNKRFGGI